MAHRFAGLVVMTISATIFGDKEVVAGFEKLPELLRAELRKSVGRAALMVERETKQFKLSGQVLNVKTGRLRRSINTRLSETADSVTGTVGTNVEYAKIHEYGFKGTVNVRAHLRQARETGRMQLVNSPGKKMKVWKRARGAKTGQPFNVRAHTRRVDLPERSFLRTALYVMRPEIRKLFEDAAARTMKSFRASNSPP